jgi:hypothetical protein
MREDERTDEQITAALRSYAEPPEAPDPRIALAHMRERIGSTRPRGSWMWIWSIPVTACILAMVLTGYLWLRPAASAPQIARMPAAPAVAPALASSPLRDPIRSAVRSTRRRGPRAAPQRLPKLDVFPTPQPLSAEEQALLAFANHSSPAIRKQVIEGQEHVGDPIAIADLKVRPLDAADGGETPIGKEKR